MKYCTYCGTVAVRKFVDRYDEDTGEKLFRDVCPNVKCEEGCRENGGHVYIKKSKGFWRRFVETPSCERCGITLAEELL